MPVRFRNILTRVAPGIFAAATLGIALSIPAKAEANTALAVFYQSNVPIIGVPPVTTPPVGVPVETESPIPVDPEPGPPDAPEPAAMMAKSSDGKGEKLYIYIVLQKDFKKDAKPAKSTPGVIGRNWYPVTKMERQNFNFKLTSAAAGNEYYVVGMRKGKGGKLEYHSKHPVRVERL